MTTLQTRVGDGYYGWPEVEGGFDIIIVTCAAEYAPPELFKQLKPRRADDHSHRPAVQARSGALRLYQGRDGKIHSRRDVGVFFIPMTGAIQKQPKAT